MLFFTLYTFNLYPFLLYSARANQI